MKRLLSYAAGFLLVGGLSFGIAQNLNRSIQLSQSAVGPIGVDSRNGVYFPYHINTNQSGSPSIGTSFGTGAAISGSDLAGEITLGTSPPASGGMNFRTAYTSTPYCVPGHSSGVSATGILVSPNGIQWTHTQTSGAKLSYICIGRSTG